MKTVKLPIPIKSGDKEITEITLREPCAGEMRGLKTFDLIQMDITAHGTLLPRICPQITKATYEQLSAKNLTFIQNEVVGFFVDAGV